MSKTKRLFIALTLPPFLLNTTSAFSSKEKGVRWVEPHNMHMTLRFLGNVDTNIIEEVKETLASVSCIPFSLTTSTVGTFPQGVLWVGVEEEEALVRLKQHIDQSLYMIGFEKETRPFIPHITIARFKPRTISDQRKFIQGIPMEPKRFQVTSFILYETVHTENRVCYTALHQFSML